jgi:hypothetical protein
MERITEMLSITLKRAQWDACAAVLLLYIEQEHAFGNDVSALLDIAETIAARAHNAMQEH